MNNISELSHENNEIELIHLGMFSDTTSDYIHPVEPEENAEITISFRMKKGSKCQIHLIQEQGKKELLYNPIRSRKDKLFDYYQVKTHVGEKEFNYYFSITVNDQNCYYDQRGVVQSPDETYSFHIIPGFSTPNWAKGAVMYQIFVERFCNGDLTNDVLSGEYKYIGRLTKQRKNWNEVSKDVGIHDFYGGDLQGVMDKLDYLKALGVEVIYLNPIFVSPSNHKYDTQDYDYIDPHFGKIVKDRGDLLKDELQNNTCARRYIRRVTGKDNLEASNQLFIKLVTEIHKRGMKIILDGVFNHCGSFHKWMDQEKIYYMADLSEKEKKNTSGAAISADSQYRKYFYFSDSPSSNHMTYEGWWGHDTLPKLNYESKELYDLVLSIAKKWIAPPYNIDGWRLDVAADLGKSTELNHQFWKDYRKVVKETNPDAIILAEHYGDASFWLNGREWDSIMNYDAFMEPISWFLTGMEKHSDYRREELQGNDREFWNAMIRNSASFTTSTLLTAMNELSNHDHSRFLTRTNYKVGRVTKLGTKAAEENVNKAVMREAVVMQMTWPGAPTVYYGDEVSLCGFTDPDNRRPYPWGREDQDMLQFHKLVISIHKKHPELKTGSILRLYSEWNILSYGRMQNGHALLTIINNNETIKTITFPVWELGILPNTELLSIITSSKKGFHTKRIKYPVKNGKLTITMPPQSAIILKPKITWSQFWRLHGGDALRR